MVADDFVDVAGAVLLALAGWLVLSAGLAGIVARGIRLRDAQEPTRHPR
jgi:hypothetical protein